MQQVKIWTMEFVDECQVGPVIQAQILWNFIKTKKQYETKSAQVEGAMQGHMGMTRSSILLWQQGAYEFQCVSWYGKDHINNDYC